MVWVAQTQIFCNVYNEIKLPGFDDFYDWVSKKYGRLAVKGEWRITGKNQEGDEVEQKNEE